MYTVHVDQQNFDTILWQETNWDSLFSSIMQHALYLNSLSCTCCNWIFWWNWAKNSIKPSLHIGVSCFNSNLNSQPNFSVHIIPYYVTSVFGPWYCLYGIVYAVSFKRYGLYGMVYMVWSILVLVYTMDYGHSVRKSPSLNGWKSTRTPKFLGTAEACFVCQSDQIFRFLWFMPHC